MGEKGSEVQIVGKDSEALSRGKIQNLAVGR